MNSPCLCASVVIPRICLESSVPPRAVSSQGGPWTLLGRIQWDDYGAVSIVIATLNRELREAVRKNRLLALMPSIERLLTLMPAHAYGKALAEKVQRRIVDGAAKCLGDHHYDQALRLLEQIAPHVRTPQAQQLHHQAAELAWLAWDLHNAPVVDATLVTVAERLRRLAPGDSRTVKLCTELQRRAQMAESQGRCEPLPGWRPRSVLSSLIQSVTVTSFDCWKLMPSP